MKLELTKLFHNFRVLVLLAIIIVTPLGFASKFYNGYLASWFNNSFGGLLYEIFWCLVIAFVFIKLNEKIIAVGVFIVTSFLEFLQLWHPHFLEVLKSTFLGRTILGNTFVPSDFFYYLIGSLAGWFILNRLKNLQIPNRHNCNSNKQ